MNPTWFAVQNAGDVAHVWIHDSIGCWNATAADLIEAIGDAKDVQLVIDSSGGDAHCAVQLHAGLYGRVSEACITGKCFSAAVIVAMAAPQIRIVRDGLLMLHPPSLACFADAAGLRQSAEYLEGLTVRCRDIICRSRKATVKPEIVHNWLAADIWFNSEKALEAGLVDEIIDRPSLEAATPMMAGAGDVDDGSEQLLLSMLAAVGRVQTKDRKKLLREMSVWVTHNLQEI